MAMLWNERFEGLMRDSLPGLAPGGQLEPEALLSALGLDSMGVIGLIGALEEEYGVSLLDDEFDAFRFRTPGEVWTTLGEALSRAAM
jgi:acyl carrier protein